MPRAYSTDLRMRVIAAMQAGATCRAVAASFDIAPSTAGKWNRAYSRSGSVGPARIGGFLRSTLEPHGAWIREQVRARPEITVRELARRVNELLGLAVGRDAVWRFLKRCGLSFKKMTRVADERERPDVKRRRERWMRHQGRIGPERLVFLDETCVKTNMAPLRGWGPKGERLPGPAPFGHWNTSTFIAALRHDRIDAPWVFDGPVNGEVFLTWVTRELVPTLCTGDLVVMENLACHKNPSVLRAIRAAGAHVLFLPPYSPDLNPIEQAFAKIKHRLRNAAARSRETLWRAVGDVLEDIEPQECANYLRNAGYGSN